MAPAMKRKGPTLKLIVEKGPTSGQIFEFKPRSRIQIGRLVHGNGVTIKDPGVSSEHAVIGFGPDLYGDPASSSCVWTVTDLDSLNGVILNDSRLQPLQPSVLSDGDVMKLGEISSIRVNFEVTEQEREGDTGKARRNPLRGQSKLGSVVEDKNNLRGRARNGDVGELGKNDEGKGRGRTLRSKSNRCEQLENVEKVNSEEVVDVGEVKGKGGREGRAGMSVSTRRTRSSKGEEKLDETGNDLCLMKAEQRASVRITRSSRNKGNFDAGLDMGVSKEEEKLDETGNDLCLMKAEQRASVRITRSSRNKGNFYTGLDMGVIEGRKTRKGTREKKKLPVEKEKLNSECEGDKGKLEEDGGNGVAKENSGKEGDDVLASTSVSSVEMVVDLEKMTLGEWLEYLEVYLPNQIINETEVMISGMRQTAEKLHELTKEKDGLSSEV